MGTVMDAREYTYVTRKTLELTGVDLDCYKSAQMQRRLGTFLLRSGQPNWPAFFRAIQDDPEAIDQFRDYLTINVSYFLRDPDKYRVLQEHVLPELLRNRLNLHVWSAGCSRGHEPYSLLMALTEITGPYRPHQILATNLDGSALAKAQAGGPYSVEEVAPVPPTWLQLYFSRRDDSYWFTNRVQRKITFLRHDLLMDPFPQSRGAGGFDLIVCRNVVIYFTAEQKDRLYRRFHDALRPGGVLFIGSTEVISRPADIGFETLDMSFYRRGGLEQRLGPLDALSRIQGLLEEVQRNNGGPASKRS
jgi:chemotaxis protein methyltransferase CheR